MHQNGECCATCRKPSENPTYRIPASDGSVLVLCSDLCLENFGRREVQLELALAGGENGARRYKHEKWGVVTYYGLRHL